MSGKEGYFRSITGSSIRTRTPINTTSWKRFVFVESLFNPVTGVSLTNKTLQSLTVDTNGFTLNFKSGSYNISEIISWCVKSPKNSALLKDMIAAVSEVPDDVKDNFAQQMMKVMLDWEKPQLKKLLENFRTWFDSYTDKGFIINNGIDLATILRYSSHGQNPIIEAYAKTQLKMRSESDYKKLEDKIKKLEAEAAKKSTH